MHVYRSLKVQTCFCAANTKVVGMPKGKGFQLAGIGPWILSARVMSNHFVFESDRREKWI